MSGGRQGSRARTKKRQESRGISASRDSARKRKSRLKNFNSTLGYCTKLGGTVATVEYKIGQVARSGVGGCLLYPGSALQRTRGRRILISGLLTGREISSEWKYTVVPQVRLPLSDQMKSFPIEYVLRHASLAHERIRMKDVWTSAKTNEKLFEKTGSK